MSLCSKCLPAQPVFGGSISSECWKLQVWDKLGPCSVSLAVRSLFLWGPTRNKVGGQVDVTVSGLVAPGGARSPPGVEPASQALASPVPRRPRRPASCFVPLVLKIAFSRAACCSPGRSWAAGGIVSGLCVGPHGGTLALVQGQMSVTFEFR